MLYHTIIKKRYYLIMNENDIWLIAGLGNPEAKYDGTRHNAGFAALDALAGKLERATSNLAAFDGLDSLEKKLSAAVQGEFRLAEGYADDAFTDTVYPKLINVLRRV